MKLENLKLGKEVEITFNEAAEILKNTAGEYYFNRLNESTISESVDFETVQNRKYFVKKTNKKGTKLYPGSEFEYKANVGIFEVEMTWDFRHPTNFCLNENNCSRTFKIAI